MNFAYHFNETASNWEENRVALNSIAHANEGKECVAENGDLLRVNKSTIIKVPSPMRLHIKRTNGAVKTN